MNHSAALLEHSKAFRGGFRRAHSPQNAPHAGACFALALFTLFGEPGKDISSAVKREWLAWAIERNQRVQDRVLHLSALRTSFGDGTKGRAGRRSHVKVSLGG